MIGTLNGVCCSTAVALVLALRVLGPSAQAAPLPPGEVAGFDLDRPLARWALPALLREVSGLAFASAGRVLAHSDERGDIVEIDYRRGTVVRRWQMGRPVIRGDFEGIELVGEDVTLMTSDGRLFTGRIPEAGNVITPVTVRDTALGRRCELEGLARAFDGSWLLGCKAPGKRSREYGFRVFGWSESTASLSGAGLSVRLGTVGRPLHPTAVVQPGMESMVVLFGPEHAIGEFGVGGSLRSLHALDSRRHPQPEGLAITADGALLIADEARGPRGGTLTVYGRAR